ncbi:methyl-accepting chemotaxis protein, partial [Sphingomonas sp. CCH9-F2]
GKGFAVVASEVRALAQRSADAAKDVKSRITASSEQVEEGVRLVTRTGEALGQIVSRISEVSALVSGIATSADQQATSLRQVNTAVAEMDGVTQQNAAMVEEATA